MNAHFFKGYQVIETLHSSKTSTVYWVKHQDTEEQYTLKAILKSSRWTLNDAVHSIHHPNIPSIIDVWEDSTFYYILKPYIPGKTLKEWVNLNGPYSIKEVEKIIQQLISIISYLHAQSPAIIFRDIKPDNLILTNNGTLFLIDTETARTHKLDQMSDTLYIATSGYAAPEQYGFSQTDVRSDVYSIGATACYLLTGQPLSQLKSVSINKKWRYIIEKSTKLNPNHRYSNLEALMKDILKRKILLRPWLLIQLPVFMLLFIFLSHTIVFEEIPIPVEPPLESETKIMLSEDYLFTGSIRKPNDNSSYIVYLVMVYPNGVVNQCGGALLHFENGSAEYYFATPKDIYDLKIGNTCDFLIYLDSNNNGNRDPNEYFQERLSISYEGDVEWVVHFDNLQREESNE